MSIALLTEKDLDRVRYEAYSEGRADQLQEDIDDLIGDACRVGAFILSKKRSGAAEASRPNEKGEVS